MLVEVERGGEVAAQPDGVAARRFPNLNKNEFKLKYLIFFSNTRPFPHLCPLGVREQGHCEPVDAGAGPDPVDKVLPRAHVAQLENIRYKINLINSNLFWKHDVQTWSLPPTCRVQLRSSSSRSQSDACDEKTSVVEFLAKYL